MSRFRRKFMKKIMPNRPRVRDTALPRTRFFFWFQTYNYRKSPLGALKEGGKNSHRRGFAAPPLGGTKGVCRLRARNCR